MALFLLPSRLGLFPKDVLSNRQFVPEAVCLSFIKQNHRIKRSPASLQNDCLPNDFKLAKRRVPVVYSNGCKQHNKYRKTIFFIRYSVYSVNLRVNFEVNCFETNQICWNQSKHFDFLRPLKLEYLWKHAFTSRTFLIFFLKWHECSLYCFRGMRRWHLRFDRVTISTNHRAKNVNNHSTTTIIMKFNLYKNSI